MKGAFWPGRRPKSGLDGRSGSPRRHRPKSGADGRRGLRRRQRPGISGAPGRLHLCSNLLGWRAATGRSGSRHRGPRQIASSQQSVGVEHRGLRREGRRVSNFGVPKDSHQFSLSSPVRADRASRPMGRAESAGEGLPSLVRATGVPDRLHLSANCRNRPTRGPGAPENSHQFSLSSLVRADRLSRSVDRSQSASEGEFLGWAMVGWERFFRSAYR
jgi:hypothetical protein